MTVIVAIETPEYSLLAADNEAVDFDGSGVNIIKFISDGHIKTKTGIGLSVGGVGIMHFIEKAKLPPIYVVSGVWEDIKSLVYGHLNESKKSLEASLFGYEDGKLVFVSCAGMRFRVPNGCNVIGLGKKKKQSKVREAILEAVDGKTGGEAFVAFSQHMEERHGLHMDVLMLDKQHERLYTNNPYILNINHQSAVPS